MTLGEAYTFSTSVSTTELSITGGTSTIQTRTTAGFYELWISKANFAKGDRFIVRLYEKVTSGGAQESKVLGSIAGVQAEPIIFPGIHLRHGWDFTIIRTTGADRTVTASVRAVT